MFYTHAVSPGGQARYSALDKLALLEPLGIHSQDWRVELFSSADERREAEAAWAVLDVPTETPVVAFSPVSRRPLKIWPPDRFAEVCDRLAERERLRFLPLFGPGEQHMVERVLDRMRRRDAVIYPCPLVSFGALLPLLTRCAFYLGNDNSIRHVATVAGIPSAAVFGPPDPRSWTPPGSDRHYCVGGKRPAEAVPVDQVEAMVARLVSTWGLGPQAGPPSA
jgi:heptosyltransferase-2/heptosyltransferase-3